MVQPPRRDNKQLATVDGILAGPAPRQNALYCDSEQWYFEGPVHISGPNPWVDVTALGAVGDGVVDCTDAIQAALDAVMYSPAKAGTVFLPAPSVWYKVTRNLRCYRSDYAQIHLNIICPGGGINGIVIAWQGTTTANDVCLYVINNIGFMFQNLLLAYSTVVGGPAGSNVGLLCSSSTTGTGTQNGLFLNCGTIGFPVGTQLGGGPIANGATSELKFINHVASYCQSGVLTVQLNTLDIFFDNLQLASNTLGGDFRSSQVVVNGGSSSGNVDDFKFYVGGTNRISGFRSETATGKFVSSVGGSQLLLDSNLVVLNTSLAEAITANSGSLTLIDNNLNGYVNITGTCFVSMYNNVIAPGVSGATTGWPFQLAGNQTIAVGARYSCYNNVNYSTSKPLENVEGVRSVNSSAVAVPRPLRHMQHDAASMWYQRLAGVTGISQTPIEAKNLRGTATFNSAATVTVTLGRAEVQSVAIIGGTPSAGSGFFVGQDVASYSDTINYNTTSTQLQNLMTGSTPAFAAATCSGGPLPGTPITITYTSNGPQWLPFVHSANLNNGASFSITRTTEGTLAEDDASYYVLVTGQANETFWVTNIAAGSFVIHSSNATSTATVHWMIVR